MSPERLQEIKNRVTRNQSAPDIAELALELIAGLEKHLVAVEKPAPSTPELIAADALPEPAPTPPAEAESGGFFSRKSKK